jgi:hypothetical protein
MQIRLRFNVTRWAYLAFAGLALANGGCLVAAGGVAAGGAVGYAYYHGNVVRYYAATMPDVLAATKTSLAELGMPVVKEEADGSSPILECRTAKGDKVRIKLDMEPSKIPSEGTLTRVGVRVATFGDQDVSERVLDQIGFHLVPVPLVASGDSRIRPTPSPIQLTAGQQPSQTAAPPLAPPPAVSGQQPGVGSQQPGQTPAPPLGSEPPLAPVAAGK